MATLKGASLATAPADRRMVLGLQRKPSPFWAQNALPKGVHASSITIALCPVKRGQLQVCSARFSHSAALARYSSALLVATGLTSLSHRIQRSVRGASVGRREKASLGKR